MLKCHNELKNRKEVQGSTLHRDGDTVMSNKNDKVQITLETENVSFYRPSVCLHA